MSTQTNRKARRAAGAGKGSGSESEGEGSGSGSGSDSGAASTPTPKKGGRRHKKDDLSEFQQPATVDPANATLYFGIAAIMSFAPAYLYATVYDLTVAENYLVYIIAITASTALLGFAYHAVCTHSYAVYSHQRKSHSTNNKWQKELNYTGPQLEDISRNVTARESLLYSLLCNNIFYLLVFFFLAFYMLRDLSVAWNYLSAQVITGGLTYYVATTFSK